MLLSPERSSHTKRAPGSGAVVEEVVVAVVEVVVAVVAMVVAVIEAAVVCSGARNEK